MALLVFIFSNNYPQSTSETLNQESTNTQKQTSEPGVSKEVIINKNGFNKDSITVEKEIKKIKVVSSLISQEI